MSQDQVASPPLTSASSPANSNCDERRQTTADNFPATEQNKSDGLDSGYNECNDSTQVEPIEVQEEPDNCQVGVAIAIEDEETKRREEQIRQFDLFVRDEILDYSGDVMLSGQVMVASQLADGIVVPNENNLTKYLPDNGSSLYELQPFGSTVNFGHHHNEGEQLCHYLTENSLPNGHSFYYPNYDDYYDYSSYYSSEGNWQPTQYDPAYSNNNLITEPFDPSNADQSVSYQMSERQQSKHIHNGGTHFTSFDQQQQQQKQMMIDSPNYDVNYNYNKNKQVGQDESLSSSPSLEAPISSNRSFISDHDYCRTMEDNNVDDDEKNPDDLSSIGALRQINAKYHHQRFPIKLWHLTGDDHFLPINWSQDGLSIMFNELTLEPVLGIFFRSKKFSSFLRQLHLYGFRKVNRSRPRYRDQNGQVREQVLDRTDYVSEYQSEYFQRDRFDLVHMARRICAPQVYQPKGTKSKRMDAQAAAATSPSSSTIFVTDHEQTFNGGHNVDQRMYFEQQQDQSARAI